MPGTPRSSGCIGQENRQTLALMEPISWWKNTNYNEDTQICQVKDKKAELGSERLGCCFRNGVQGKALWSGDTDTETWRKSHELNEQTEVVCPSVGTGNEQDAAGVQGRSPTWSQDRVSSASGGSDTSLRHWGKAMWVCQWSACAPRETWVQPGSRACWPCDKVWHHGLSWSSALRTQALPSRGPYGNSEEERDASSLKTDLQPPQEKQRTNSSKGKTFGRLKRVRDVNQSQWCWAMWTHWPAFRHILDHKKKEKKRKSYMDVKKKKLFRLHSLA